MEKFKLSKAHAANGRKVWAKGDDTAGNPFIEIHAPYDRVAAPDAYLLYFVNPLERQFKTQSQRAKWLKFATYKAAQQYAKSLLHFEVTPCC